MPQSAVGRSQISQMANLSGRPPLLHAPIKAWAWPPSGEDPAPSEKEGWLCLLSPWHGGASGGLGLVRQAGDSVRGTLDTVAAFGPASVSFLT